MLFRSTGNLYVAEANRKSALIEIGDGLLSLARTAKVGSDLQLQLVKFFPQFAQTDAQLDALRGLLDGTEVLGGLEVDADLRWELLTGLVVAGRAGEAEIAAELTRDNTANGQKAAAGARAAIPTAAAKQAAWDLLVERSEEHTSELQSH